MPLFYEVIKMEIKDIFEKVNLKSPIEQRRFFNYYNDTINEMKSLYSPFVFVEKDVEDEQIHSLDDEITVRPMYETGIVDNILYLNGLGAEYKQMFYEKTRSAWLEYWSRYAKGARVKRKRW